MHYEVIIIGGSYAGLSAAMALGRARRHVLVIDGGLPRNRFTPHAHNLLLHDGDAPAALAARARQQLVPYPTVRLLAAEATAAARPPDGTFAVHTARHGTFGAPVLVLATGLRDELSEVPGFAACWGRSIIHCPYCHGYEVADRPTGLWLNNGHTAELVQLLLNWTADLTVFTDGPVAFGSAVGAQLAAWGVPVVETPIAAVQHRDGQLTSLRLADGRTWALPVLYAPRPYSQASALPAQLGCGLTDNNLLEVDGQNQTTVPGVYAIGDNCSRGHQLVQAMAAGNAVGVALSRQFIAQMHPLAAAA